MHFNIAICDDVAADAEIISNYLKDYDSADISVTVFTDPRTLMAAYTKAGTFDIVFLDVEMPVYDGLAVAKYIREIPDYAVKIIFVSGYPAYMQDSFEVQAYHYLEKPPSLSRIDGIIKHIIREKSDVTEHKLCISDNNGDHFIDPNDLYYVDIDRTSYRTLRFHTQKSFMLVHISIKDCEKVLLENNFVYVYRGTLVNLKHLHVVKTDSVMLDNKVVLRLSRRYEQNIRQKYIRYNVNSIYFR